MTRFITVKEKPLIMRSGGVWCCVGLPQKRHWVAFLSKTTPVHGYGFTPHTAYWDWYNKAAR